jgi:NAD-dependent DNA ligase
MRASTDIHEKIKKLRETISGHGYRYHVLDKPDVSDEVYD